MRVAFPHCLHRSVKDSGRAPIFVCADNLMVKTSCFVFPPSYYPTQHCSVWTDFRMDGFSRGNIPWQGTSRPFRSEGQSHKKIMMKWLYYGVFDKLTLPDWAMYRVLAVYASHLWFFACHTIICLNCRVDKFTRQSICPLRLCEREIIIYI